MSQIFQKPPSNYGYTVGLRNAVDFEITPVTVTGPAADVAGQSVIFPANTMVQNGQILVYETFITAVLPSGTRNFKLDLNGVVFFEFGPQAMGPIDTQGIKMRSTFCRTGPTNLLIYTEPILGYSLSPAIAAGVISERASYAVLSNANFAINNTIRTLLTLATSGSLINIFSKLGVE